MRWQHWAAARLVTWRCVVGARYWLDTACCCVLQARVQAAKQSVEKVVKSTPKAPKKRKLRDAPSHLRFGDDWSDVEDRTFRKRQKQQVSASSQS